MGLKRKLIKWLKNDWYNDEVMVGSNECAPVRDHDCIGDHGDRYNFSVTRADGGMIVAFNKYDRKLDRSNSGLHVIPDGADFNHELVKIVSLELLKH